MGKENYFNADYLQSRKKTLKELKEYAESELLKPQKNWNIVWVLSGPEINFSGDINPGEKAVPNYNQTKSRFETGLKIAREVTALRLNKQSENVTKEDIANNGPSIYFNSGPASNNFIREIARPNNLLETEYNFPGQKVIITNNENIKHTGDQFQDFPAEIVEPNTKVVIVSALQHYPRIRRYAQKYPDKLPPEQVILYPVPIEKNIMPVSEYLGEIKRIYPYQKKGFLPPEAKK